MILILTLITLFMNVPMNPIKGPSLAPPVDMALVFQGLAFPWNAAHHGEQC